MHSGKNNKMNSVCPVANLGDKCENFVFDQWHGPGHVGVVFSSG